MVSKIIRSFFIHIAAAMRGWKNRHSRNLPVHHRKRPASHSYNAIARRRRSNAVAAGITIADIKSARARFITGSSKFISGCFPGMNTEQISRALHCLNAHRSNLNKYFRHLINEL